MGKNNLGRSKPGAVIDKASLLDDLRSLVNSGRRLMAVLASVTQLVLYWRVGQRLLKQDLRKVKSEFGDGFSYSLLTRMVRFAEIQPDETIVATLSQQLGPPVAPLHCDCVDAVDIIEWDFRRRRRRLREGGPLPYAAKTSYTLAA